jgi:hypothetical protein
MADREQLEKAKTKIYCYEKIKAVREQQKISEHDFSNAIKTLHRKIARHELRARDFLQKIKKLQEVTINFLYANDPKTYFEEEILCKLRKGKSEPLKNFSKFFK